MGEWGVLRDGLQWEKVGDNARLNMQMRVKVVWVQLCKVRQSADWLKFTSSQPSVERSILGQPRRLRLMMKRAIKQFCHALRIFI